MSHDVSMPAMVRALDLAVAETLETMFFTDASRTDQNSADCDASLCTVVQFTGDAVGCLQLRITAASAAELAANFLGVDTAEVSRLQRESVCAELANMVCGAMVSISSPEGSFALMPPEIVECPPSSPGSVTVLSYQVLSDILELRLSCTAVEAFPE